MIVRIQTGRVAGFRGRGAGWVPGVTIALMVLLCPEARAQNAQLSGHVQDAQQAAIGDAGLTLTREDTGLQYRTRTNAHGLYIFASVRPGVYRLEASASGFLPIVRTDVTLEVDQAAVLNLSFDLAARTESVTVTADKAVLGTHDGSRGTVVDRKFAANIPLSGRTIHSLIALAPGVVSTPNSGGSFSVNGQRGNTNYMTVDGVSANVGAGTQQMTDRAAGQMSGTTITGGLNGFASVDSLQEFRIQTSTFAPEYGRTPGAQISLVTRAGGNRLVGSLFEQVRHDSLDANNWFTNLRGLERPTLRQSTFGGTLGGPILSNRLFYFGSYEGLRLKQPRPYVSAVPSLAARGQATGAMRDFLSSYPQPTGPDRPNRTADFATNAHDRTSSDALALRLDAAPAGGTQVFARYSHTPSSKTFDQITKRGRNDLTLDGLTVGLTQQFSARTVADVRVNRSVAEVVRPADTDAPFTTLVPVLPVENGRISMDVASTGLGPVYGNGPTTESAQVNLVASVSHSLGSHQIKVGTDYRRLRSFLKYPGIDVSVTFTTVESALANTASQVNVTRYVPVVATFHNVSLYAQDTWRASSRLSFTYGLRWDLNRPPSFDDEGAPLAASDASDPAALAYVPERGTPLWRTRTNDLAPRAGFSYAFDDRGVTVLTAGAGLFYDMTGQSAGIAFTALRYPNFTRLIRTSVPMPLGASDLQGLSDPSLTPPYRGNVNLIDPDLRAPRSTQWNVAVERQLGSAQVASLAYVGARSLRLLSTRRFVAPNTNFPDTVDVTRAAGESNYQSLQVQYRRRAVKGLHVLASYTLGRARDTASVGLTAQSGDWAAADFDARHTFASAVSWELPRPSAPLPSALFGGFAIDVLGRARSGLPLTVDTGQLTNAFFGGIGQRANLVPGVPVTIDDPVAPGGRRLNRAAFAIPAPGVQGDLSRNSIRGAGAWQVDMALRRTFTLAYDTRLQFRIDAFNVFNIPHFNQPVSTLSFPNFGEPASTLNNSGGAPGDQLTDLYQWGGPRSIEVSVKFLF
jgi:Carboxypeptidase regulatory-like domain/TonB dependent receptor